MPIINSARIKSKDQLSTELETGIMALMDKTEYRNWLDTASRLYANNYSFQNAVLVHLQKPDASYVMGSEAWKNFGRGIRAGSRGAKIIVPVKAYEKQKGAFYRHIVSDLRTQINGGGGIARCRIGVSDIEFTMDRSGQIGLVVGGIERGIQTEYQAKRFIKDSVFGRVPMYYTMVSVFDVKDTDIPECLWVKRGYTDAEVIKNGAGDPVRSGNGEVKIVNTTERRARFPPWQSPAGCEESGSAGDTEKLYGALLAVNERIGVSVREVSPDEESDGSGERIGYYCHAAKEILISSDLSAAEKCSVLMRETARSYIYNDETYLFPLTPTDCDRQAESIAYITGKHFGIETDTSSFEYKMRKEKELELKDIQKSISAIYNEAKSLIGDIQGEMKNLERETGFGTIKGTGRKETESARRFYPPPNPENIRFAVERFRELFDEKCKKYVSAAIRTVSYTRSMYGKENCCVLRFPNPRSPWRSSVSAVYRETAKLRHTGLRYMTLRARQG